VEADVDGVQDADVPAADVGAGKQDDGVTQSSINLFGGTDQICNVTSTELCHSVLAVADSSGALMGLSRENLLNQNDGYMVKESELVRDENFVSFSREAAAVNKDKRVLLFLAFEKLTADVTAELQN